MNDEEPRGWIPPASNEEAWARLGGLVKRRAWVLRRYVEKMFGVLYDRDELIGSVWEVFNRAVDGFKPELGHQFSTYFFGCRCRELDRFVRDDSMKASLRVRTRKELFCCSLNADSHEQDFVLYRVPEHDESWTEAIFDLFDGDRDALWKSLLESLHPRMKEVVTLYFKEGWTLEMIGDKFGVSRERVRQIRVDAIRRMRTKVEKLTDVASVFGLWDATKTGDGRYAYKTRGSINLNPSKNRSRKGTNKPRKPKGD